MLGGQHIANAYVCIRAEMLAKEPDVQLEERWRGGYGEILAWNTPVPICRIASRLHNRRQHNSQKSTFYDLIRKMAQRASEVQAERAGLRLAEAIALGQHVVGQSDPIPVVPAEAMLSPDDVYQAYLDSGYQDATTTATATGKGSASKPKTDVTKV
jgi:hypothetical protein